MKVYTADANYCNYLHYYEPKIPFVKNEKENRPFIGTLLCVNGKNFFAPLTSPKPKHLTMKNAQDFLKIDNGKLGGINLNNMIPIPKSCLQEIEIRNIKDIKYRNMLFKQMDWIEKNKVRINNRAKNLYFLIIKKKATDYLIERCCNFKLLEEKCCEYMNGNSLMEDEVLYIY